MAASTLVAYVFDLGARHAAQDWPDEFGECGFDVAWGGGEDPGDPVLEDVACPPTTRCPARSARRPLHRPDPASTPHDTAPPHPRLAARHRPEQRHVPRHLRQRRHLAGPEQQARARRTMPLRPFSIDATPSSFSDSKRTTMSTAAASSRSRPRGCKGAPGPARSAPSPQPVRRKAVRARGLPITTYGVHAGQRQGGGCCRRSAERLQSCPGSPCAAGCHPGASRRQRAGSSQPGGRCS